MAASDPRTTGESLLELVTGVEARLLAGKRERGDDLESAVRIFLEFLRGFEAFEDIDAPCVTIFGSARIPEGHRYYEMARALGRVLAQHGYCVMTGGGPGIMEAANRGAKEGGGLSLGCSITLPFEEKRNDYLDRAVTFEHFFVRKVILVKYSCAFVLMPGGFGTLDEAFQTITLIQTGKIQHFPVIAMGKDFWNPINQPLLSSMLAQQTIDQQDARLLASADTPEDVLALIDAGAAARRALVWP
jgi:uncharacterized protein (TIGR00730 family)